MNQRHRKPLIVGIQMKTLVCWGPHFLKNHTYSIWNSHILLHKVFGKLLSKYICKITMLESEGTHYRTFEGAIHVRTLCAFSCCEA